MTTHRVFQFVVTFLIISCSLPNSPKTEETDSTLNGIKQNYNLLDQAIVSLDNQSSSLIFGQASRGVSRGGRSGREAGKSVYGKIILYCLDQILEVKESIKTECVSPLKAFLAQLKSERDSIQELPEDERMARQKQLRIDGLTQGLIAGSCIIGKIENASTPPLEDCQGALDEGTNLIEQFQQRLDRLKQDGGGA